MKLKILLISYLLLFTFSANAEFLRDNTNSIVLDTSTNLTWEDGETTTNIYTWIDAIDYCNDLTHGGFDDWRTPNINELNTIVDDTKYNPAIKSIFINTISNGNYWSSTSYTSSNPTYGRMIGFTSGSISNNPKENSHYVRCVRDGEVAPDPTVLVHNGTTYNTVTSPFTGKKWLDRNLGASQVCTAYNDSACYGDYYQWGRNHDGHQVSTSGTTTTLATNVSDVGHGNFIINSESPYDWSTEDSEGNARSANWSKADGTSVCPSGYRVPTEAELKAETTGASTQVTNHSTAYSNFLKLPSAGFRFYSSGSMDSQGTDGLMWSSSVSGSGPWALHFFAGGASWGGNYRTYGFSVRCVRD